MIHQHGINLCMSHEQMKLLQLLPDVKMPVYTPRSAAGVMATKQRRQLKALCTSSMVDRDADRICSSTVSSSLEATLIPCWLGLVCVLHAAHTQVMTTGKSCSLPTCKSGASLWKDFVLGLEGGGVKEE